MAIDFGQYRIQRLGAGATDRQIQNEWAIYSANLQQQQSMELARQTTEGLTRQTATIEQQLAEQQRANAATVQQLTSGFQNQLAATSQGYQSLLDQLAGMQVQYQEQMGQTLAGIEGSMKQQQQQYQEQLAKSANLARASVPMPAPSATAPTLGRAKRGGENASNMLANLTIFNRPMPSNPLAGLQIA